MEQKLEQFRERIGKIFIGKEEVTELVLCAFLAGGHILLEDVPGVGKTTLARAFAALCSLSFGPLADVQLFGCTIFELLPKLPCRTL